VGYEEAYRVWNMGVGMVLVIPEAALGEAMGTLPEAMVIGRLAPRAAGGASVELV
jgi:phosphoribosylaminoimidazole (AIR) synthetase